jgi:CheY-like chemotaxis protein
MNRERVLIVDDNADNLRLIELLLKCEGYDVRTAEDAKATLAILESFRPDLILMDIQLPGMDGLALTRRLRQMPSLEQVQIVALSAYAMPADKEHARDAGCNGYITKPIDTRAFPSLVRQYLAETATPKG